MVISYDSPHGSEYELLAQVIDYPFSIGEGEARLDEMSLSKLGMDTVGGEMILLTGKTGMVLARCFELTGISPPSKSVNGCTVAIDILLRQNLGVQLGDYVKVQRVKDDQAPDANVVEVYPESEEIENVTPEMLSSELQYLPVMKGNLVMYSDTRRNVDKVKDDVALCINNSKLANQILISLYRVTKVMPESGVGVIVRPNSCTVFRIKR